MIAALASFTAPIGGTPDLAGAFGPEGFSTVVKFGLLMTVLAILPSILVMFTCFIRLIVVFGSPFSTSRIGMDRAPSPSSELSVVSMSVSIANGTTSVTSP